ncbi:hypothetical protein Tco_0308454 [Tanacetum coccineum]
MPMIYCFVNNIHVDYAELLWEGLYYSLPHPNIFDFISKLYKRSFHLLHDIFPGIQRLRQVSQLAKDDDIMKNIFNSGRHKDKVGMQIPAWMITEEMKHTEHYRMYAEVFRIDVPLTHHEAHEQEKMWHGDDHMHLMKIEKMVDGQENVVDDSSIPRNDESNIPGTRIEPRSNKESPKVEITKDKEVEITEETLVVDITNVVIPVNVNDKDEEITDKVYELKRREKGKNVEETRNSPIPTPIRSPRIHTNLVSSDTEKLHELTDTHTTSSSSSPHTKLSKTNQLLSLFKTKPTLFKRYKSFFHELQARNQEQDDDFNFWTDSYASDDDEIPTKQVSQDIMEEVSLTIDEAKLRKMADKMLRQRCTSGDEHQYHIDQMKNFLKSDIVWESRKEILVSPHPRKTNH